LVARQAANLKTAMSNLTPESLFSTLDLARDVFLLVRDGGIVKANRAWKTLTGFSSQELVGRPLEDFLHPDDHGVLKGLGADPKVEHKVRLHPGGPSELKGLIRAQPVDEDGTLLVAIRNLDDADDMIATEASRRALALLRDDSDIYLWSYNPADRNYLYDLDFSRPNQPYSTDEGAHGVRLNRPRGARAQSAMEGQIHPEDAERVRASFLRVVSSGDTETIEYRRQRPDQTWAHIRTVWRGVVLTRAGWELMGLSLDVSELVEARNAAIAAAEAKSQFLANMSHEIRTPMNGVLGMNALLMRGPLTDEQRTFGESVRISAERLLGVINDVLDISKLEAGKLELEDTDFFLATIVEDVAELLSPQASEKKLEIACFIDQSARGAVRGDPTRVRQVLLNLLSNALKFTERGYVAIEARAQPAGEGRLALRVEVQDTGIGVPEDVKPQLFESFVQADGSVTRKYGGTGLGLAICRQLIQLMGGRIGVNDRPGGGSVFWFEIELARGQPAQPMAMAIRHDLNEVRILVVDDIDLNRSIFLRQLEADGAIVEAAESGAEALERIAAAERAGAPFDIVILDHMMPEMSGDMVAAAIRADPSLTQPRLVLASSIGAPLSTDPAANVGIDVFLTKPIRHAALVERLAVLLGRAAPEEEVAEAEDLARPKSGKRILLAEDNEINILLARTLLEEAGHEVESVKTGVQAVDAVTSRAFDLILMDMLMPEMDGLEATRAIRALPPPASETPILAMTANAMRADADACLEAGMDDFVSKPIDPDTFLDAVGKMLSAPQALAGVALKPPRAGADGPPDLDETQIKGLARILPPERLRKVVETYLASGQSQLQRILSRATASQIDFDQTARDAHELKGVSGNFGARRLHALAADLEAAAKATDAAEIARLAIEIRFAADAVWPKARALLEAALEAA
jgi:PAS domain S-box-containing protein